ncbi:MAG: TIGR00645 family protein [Hyphomonadaceae bacterium]|nr:TIGR00645 family protein [Hyphomonadaceae bacterium]
MSRAEKSDPHASPLLERALEWVIYSSRWLMAPVYLGLIAALGILIITFFRELYLQAPQVLTMDETDIILLVLTLVDLSLAGNLVLIILFSGYENFVSKIEAAHRDKDRPEWMGTVDFSGLKIKLIASIVAISGIHLLKIFMNLSNYTETQLLWYVIIHITFIFSGVCVAAMDWLEEKAHEVHARYGSKAATARPSAGDTH